MPQFCPKNCPDRYSGCHASCEGYKTRKAKWEAYKDRNKEIENYERMVQSDIRKNSTRKQQRLKKIYR